MAKFVDTLYKQPGEARLLDMDFSNKMRTGEAIVSIDSIVYDPVDLTTDSSTFNGQVVQILISGGSLTTRTDIDYNEYVVTVTVTTDLAQVLENEGFLRIQETPVA